MYENQIKLIECLTTQPLIIVIRLDFDFFNNPHKRDELLLKIKNLSKLGIKNIEIGWDPNPNWINLVSEIKNKFHHINFGVASICSIKALDTILPLKLNYAMSPVFKKEIHLKAIKNNQLVIPGISNIENYNEAINLGYKVIKIYPASELGFKFIHKLKRLQENDIFFIGAGGIKSRDLSKFLKNGYNALAIGKELKNQIPDKDLQIWLKDF